MLYYATPPCCVISTVAIIHILGVELAPVLRGTATILLEKCPRVTVEHCRKSKISPISLFGQMEMGCFGAQEKTKQGQWKPGPFKGSWLGFLLAELSCCLVQRKTVFCWIVWKSLCGFKKHRTQWLEQK
ncbi:hypothetical protein AMECASPLE_003272 [Ameca splendens]|uniref:Uncharacterized protein n=1 Tax=Ameca splendens TaxID=208324 RepID=A0ABV0YL64_9TELE